MILTAFILKLLVQHLQAKLFANVIQVVKSYIIYNYDRTLT